MIYVVLVPVVAVLVLVMQVSLVDILSGGTFRVEFSLVLVLYAGFHMTVLRGLWIAAVFGFVLDTLTGTLPFFHTFFYVLVFAAARAVSFRVSGDAWAMIMLATFTCSLVGGLVALVFQGGAGAFVVFIEEARRVAVSGMLLALASPLIFALFDKVEAMINAESR